MAVLYVPVGIPACGKSTYASGGKWTVVSSDGIRKELFGSEAVQGDPKKVFRIAHGRAREALLRGEDVYFDATNLTRRARSELLLACSGAYDEAVALVFTTPLEECLERNKKRERTVPEDAVRAMHRRMQMPETAEGFSRIESI